jgi:diamine N-acetyltransferase
LHPDADVKVNIVWYNNNMIEIRKHERSDVIYRVKWLNNIQATQFAVDDPEKGTTLELQKEWFDRYEPDEKKKFFTIEYSGQPIGFMGLSNIDSDKRTAVVFILIGEDEFRGRGIGKEAMRWLIDYAWNTLELTELTLEVKKENLPAVKLYKSLNFSVHSESEIECYKMSLFKSKR